eukprot:scaffold41232_cov66-Phaeocystis_antarctica.AAC.8
MPASARFLASSAPSPESPSTSTLDLARLCCAAWPSTYSWREYSASLSSGSAALSDWPARRTPSRGGRRLAAHWATRQAKIALSRRGIAAAAGSGRRCELRVRRWPWRLGGLGGGARSRNYILPGPNGY